MEHIVIVGAGIIGASLAYHLGKRGAHVTVIEAQHPASGASGKSFGWLNATFSKQPRSYFDLSMMGIAGWHRLQRELDGLLNVQWGGSVAWFPPGADAEQLRRDVAHHREWGYAVGLINEAEFCELLPSVSPGPIGAACHAELEGAVDPVTAVKVLLDKATEFGADLKVPCSLTGFELAGGQVRAVRTSEEMIETSAVVLASGIDLPRLAGLAGVNVPLKDAPGVLVHLTPDRPLIDRIVQAPGVHFRQKADGRIVAGGQIVGGAGTAATPIADQSAIFKKLAEYLDFDATIEMTTLGFRVMPLDEYPILGFAESCSNVYVAATHSGVTLAPVIGELASVEILDNVRQDAFGPYRPERFT